MIDAAVLRQFPGAAGYLDTASLGLPPQSAVDELMAAIAEWQAGAAEPPRYDRYVEEARASFAAMVDVPVEQVAVGAQVSAMVAMAATVLEPASRVLVPEGEFTSATFPFLTRHDLALDIVTAPLERLAEAVDAGTALVSFSLVQSSDGRVADGEAIREAAVAAGALTLVDATQAAGWLPFRADDYDFTVSGTYKWLLCPRGTAFMTVRPELLERVQAAVWRVVRGREALGDDLWAAAAAGLGRVAPGPLAGVAGVGGHGGFVAPARGGRRGDHPRA
jgi:selenocysteine lyase/cysteine desulfurase